MNCLHTTAAALLVLALATSGCAQNRSLPARLAPSKMTNYRRQQLSVARGDRHRVLRPAAPGEPNSGVIITDWYSSPKAPGERVKLTVAVLDPDLRADALRVSAARQVNQSGALGRCPGDRGHGAEARGYILTRARDLRRATVRG